MIFTNFNNEQKQNPKECFEHEIKMKTAKMKTEMKMGKTDC
jgi:hypothetical protein